MSVIAFDFYAEDAPNGTLLGTLDDTDCLSMEFRVELHGLGSGLFTISRHHVDAALVAENNLVKVRIPSVDTDPIFAFWLKEGDFSLIHHDEQGGEILTFGGPGIMYILALARLYHSSLVYDQPARGSLDRPGQWTWINEPYGAILTRIVEEGRENPFPDAAANGSALEHVTITFDRVNDSNSVAWPNITEEYEERIGTDILQVAERLREAGSMYYIMSPTLQFDAVQSYGRNLAGAFGAGTVRFEKGVNILTELRRDIAAREELTHLLLEDSDGNYSTEVRSGYTAAERKHWGYFAASQTNDDTLLNAIGADTIRRSNTHVEALSLEITPGFVPASGRYMPGPAGTSGHFWVGDTVTLHTGTGTHDYNAAAQLVTAIRVVLDEAADDSTADKAARSLHIVPELNYEAVRSARWDNGTGPAGHTHTPSPELCRALTPGVETLTRLYPSVHLSGNNDTAECDVAPDLTGANVAANWDYTGSPFDYYYMYDTPQSSGTGTGAFATWSATDAAAGEAVISGFTHILDGTLLAGIQSGGTLRGQFRMRSRYGVGISESAQDNRAAMAVRVYRPGTGFVATLADVGSAGSTAFVAQSMPANRSFIVTLAAYASAASGDYVVVDLGTQHITPATGGTGATLFIMDSAASDLPEDETSSDNLNAWIEFRSTTAATGEGNHPDLVGTSIFAARCDHKHHIISNRAPTTADDITQGYPTTTMWTDTTTNLTYLLIDEDTGEWILVSTAGEHTHDASDITGLTVSGLAWYFPEDYGALGDGTTDDAVALQDCFDDAASVHGLVKLGAKEYVCSAKLDIDIGPITVLGDGAEFGQGAAGYGTSRIRFTNSNAHHIDVAAAGNGSIFRGFRVDGPGGTQTAGAGIYSLKYISVDHVVVDGCYDGIRLGAESYYSELHHVMCYDQDNIGIRIENGANNANLFNPRVHTAVTGISIEGCEKVAIHGGTVEQCTTGILVNAGANTTGGVTIAGLYFEQAAGANTDIAIGRTGTPQGVIVSGNKFTQHNTTGYHIDAERVSGLSIIGNDFRSTATTVRIQSSITGKAIFMGNRNAGTYSIATDKGLIVDTLGATTAADVSITDTGAYYTGTDVEAALQEIGADLAGGVGGGAGELMIADSHSTPLVFADILQNDTQDDFLYEG